MTARPGDSRTRAERVADAAISIVATGGLRALTHRAVDEAAGLPNGSTSNVFRSRRALVVGTLERITDLDTADIEELGTDPAEVVDLLDRWTHRDPERLRARLELNLESLRDPEVAEIMDTARNRLVTMIDEARIAAPEQAPQLPGLTSSQIVALLGALQWAEVTTGERLTEEILARLMT